MTETTYEMIVKDLDKIDIKLHQIGEANDLSELSTLSAQIRAVKENLARLLWVALPELNNGGKFEQLFNRSTGIYFSPGVFEIDAMRQAFFKRQALTFFNTEEEQQAYIKHAENQYLRATKSYKEIMKDTKQTMPSASYLVQVIEKR